MVVLLQYYDFIPHLIDNNVFILFWEILALVLLFDCDLVIFNFASTNGSLCGYEQEVLFAAKSDLYDFRINAFGIRLKLLNANIVHHF